MERENGVCRESDSGIAHTYRTTAEPEGRGEDVSNPTENWKFLPLGIGLEPKVIQQVTDLANETGKSRSEMIRELINEALDARMKAAK